jgi:hypothetical protein
MKIAEKLFHMYDAVGKAVRDIDRLLPQVVRA